MQLIRHTNGFTLLEVMIALVIFSIGLIGLAGLQAISLENNQVAYSRSMATILAYDLADRIRNNKAKDGTVPSYVHTTPGTITAPAKLCMGTSVTCNQTELKDFDLYEWDTLLKDGQTNLTNAIGVVTLTGSTYTILVAWDEARSGTTPAASDCASTPTAGIGCAKIEVVP